MKKSGSLLCHRAGDQARPRGPEDGTRQELTEAAPVGTGSGTVLKPRDPQLDQERSPVPSLLFPFVAVPWPQAPTHWACRPTGSSLLLQPALPSLPEACSTGSQPAPYFSLRSGAHLCKTGAGEGAGLQYK